MKKIYYLYEIGINIPMYIGVTGQSLKNRLRSHKCSKGNTKREVWIRKALLGGGLGIEQIEEVDDSVCIEREKYWTIFYADTVVNLRIGNGVSDELSKILSEGQKKKKINWDAIKKTQQKNTGKKRSKIFCDNLSNRMKGKRKNELHVLKMKNTQREKYGRPVFIDDKRYTSIADAVENTGYTKSIITSYLKNKIKKRKYNIHE